MGTSIERDRLNAAVARLFGLRENLEQHGVKLDELEDLHIFGYGSLPDKPHWQPTSMTPAFLTGFRRSFCCKCISRGTDDFTGLTLGLEKLEDGVVPGAVLSYRNIPLGDLADMMHVFADREVPRLKIYHFGLCDTELADGRIVKALACFADTGSENYLHGMSVTEKSQIIAMASGEKGTCKTYLDHYVRLRVQNARFDDHPPERQIALMRDKDYFMRLMQAVDLRRAEMRLTMPEYVAQLEELEAQQLHLWQVSKGKADNVFENDNPAAKHADRA
ncbi:MAG: hypothetical protein HND56_02425 [Pseudomonadota bacterium]|nr:MAG: hypothetical protein HND56_02425 [Pseudomonadota bacterium]